MNSLKYVGSCWSQSLPTNHTRFAVLAYRVPRAVPYAWYWAWVQPVHWERSVRNQVALR